MKIIPRYSHGNVIFKTYSVNYLNFLCAQKKSRIRKKISKINKGDMTSVNETIVFSGAKPSGNFKKINITNSDGKKVMIETEKCFSWGIQKSDRYDSYSMALVLKNDSETVKTLERILQKCKDHLPEKEFGKCLYETTNAKRQPSIQK